MPIRFRPAVAADYPAFALLFRELDISDPVPSPDVFARISETTIFAEEGDEPIGYVLYRAQGTAGHINNLVVSPAARNAGLGRSLMLKAAGRLRAEGCTTWALFAKQHNAPAQALYRKLGMARVHEAAVLRMTWADICAAQPGAHEDVVVDVTDAMGRDRAIEQDLDLEPGAIARIRRNGQSVLKAALDGERVVGVAAFQPRFPGIRLLRATRPTVAIGLIQQCEPHRIALEGDAACWRNCMVQVVVERQEEIAQALREHGAELRFRLDYLRGTLPRSIRTGRQQKTIAGL